MCFLAPLPSLGQLGWRNTSKFPSSSARSCSDVFGTRQCTKLQIVLRSDLLINELVGFHLQALYLG